MSTGLKMQRDDVHFVLEVCESIACVKRVAWQQSSAAVRVLVEHAKGDPELQQKMRVAMVAALADEDRQPSVEQLAS